MKHIRWADHALVALYKEGAAGKAPDAQLAGIVDELDSALRSVGLSLETAVRHRVWTRDRQAREATNDARARLITGNRRCATSSFIDSRRFVSAADVAMELVAQYPGRDNRRRLVDFEPPRRYAHYLVQDGLFFMSGMAESGATLDEQFDKAFGEVRHGMSMEGVSWHDVLSASLFIERGHGDPAWLIERLRNAVPVALPYVACEQVDGLASADKHLEIEITAKLTG